MERKTHIIDATGRTLGRLAVETANLLRGKQKTDFVLNKDMGDLVIVKNIDKLKIDQKKLKQKKYYRHSGYLGSLKETSLAELFKKDPSQVFKKAVFGMLPKNKLRAKTIKKLKFE